MSAFPSLSLRSHAVSLSAVDSFVSPAENVHWLGGLINRARQAIMDSTIFGTRSEKVESPGPITCASWHPSQTDQIAFGMSDGVVQVIVQPSSKPILLRNQHQSSITCLAWQPNSTKTLSVGCSTGVFVWEVISQKSSSLPSRTTLHSTPGPVSSLSYTPDGRLCLVMTRSRLLVFDCVTGDDGMSVRSVTDPGFISVSPSYCFALLADGSRFHILRGITEGCETFTRLQSPVKCAAWSPSGSHLIFALTDTWLVLALEIYSPQEVKSKVSPQTSVLIDLHKTLAYNEGENWCIEEMSMDGSGQRLAVLARESHSAASKVFLFGVTLLSASVFELDVVAENMGPTHILYQHKPRQGAMLCVCCDNGDVNFIPDTTLPS